MQKLDATQFVKGTPHLLTLDKSLGLITLVHDGKISIGDALLVYKVAKEVVEVLEERPAKGDYSPRKNKEFTFYKLAIK